MAGKQRKRFDGQPVVRSAIARAAWNASGAGRHGKSKKATRRAERIAVKRGDIA